MSQNLLPQSFNDEPDFNMGYAEMQPAHASIIGIHYGYDFGHSWPPDRFIISEDRRGAGKTYLIEQIKKEHNDKD